MSRVPLQLEAEPGWSHLPEKSKENAGSVGGEASPVRALGLARGKRQLATCLFSRSTTSS